MINATKTCLLTLCVGGSLVSLSQGKNQSVIASAGDVSKIGNLMLEWTLGEPIVETASGATLLYTQGFHQPLLQVRKWNSGRNIASTRHAIQVYPNPAAAVVTIQLDKISETPLQISVIDVNGKVLLNNILPVRSALHRLNVSPYPKGVYLLRITDPAGIVYGEYKLIKAH